MNIKKDLLKKINKKSKEYKEYREYAAGKIKPEKIVSSFINEIEQAHVKCTNGADFSYKVDAAITTMCRHIWKIDDMAIIDVVWNREEEAENWGDLRPIGVNIKWGEVWRKENPRLHGEQYISVEQLWLESL